ncbi:hypothetical protein CIK91_01170 [Segatella bryantii]|uniref:Uncharacterized protein n=1 Tax=Segatella bryantii TaxID=77095 RepID=A0ABX4EKG7_SEGBR|nr:hypothetical protein CIK91_01170 [Segatella bryantii]
MSIATICISWIAITTTPNVLFRSFISNKFPRLLAKCEITANANLYVWAQKPHLFLFLESKFVQSLQASLAISCMIIIFFRGSFVKLFAKVLNFIENLLDCMVK